MAPPLLFFFSPRQLLRLSKNSRYSSFFFPEVLSMKAGVFFFFFLFPKARMRDGSKILLTEAQAGGFFFFFFFLLTRGYPFFSSVGKGRGSQSSCYAPCHQFFLFSLSPLIGSGTSTRNSWPAANLLPFPGGRADMIVVAQPGARRFSPFPFHFPPSTRLQIYPRLRRLASYRGSVRQGLAVSPLSFFPFFPLDLLFSEPNDIRTPETSRYFLFFFFLPLPSF